MTISATETAEDGYFLGFAENDENGKKAFAESERQGEALSIAINLVKG